MRLRTRFPRKEGKFGASLLVYREDMGLNLSCMITGMLYLQNSYKNVGVGHFVSNGEAVIAPYYYEPLYSKTYNETIEHSFHTTVSEVLKDWHHDIDARVGEVLENTTAEKTNRNEAQFEWLRRHIDCRNFKADNYITPTGIPPHVGLMVELSGYKAEIAEMREKLYASIEESLKRHITVSVMTKR
ncbi:hypothetical protein PHMEG_00038329, partial [Phytophthora megakarya]